MGSDFKDKVVGVTGAASVKGIGFAIAKKFLESGAKVFICDLNSKALEEATAQLMSYGQVNSYVLDVGNEEAVVTMFSKAHEYYGKIDIFVNNAGIYPQCPICEMDVKQWDLTMNVNVKSVFLCAREAYKYMKNTGGVIINAASYAALIGSAGSGAYAASKSAEPINAA